MVLDLVNKLFIGYEKDLYAVLLYTVAMVVYAVIIWHFYRNLATRDLIWLNIYKVKKEKSTKKIVHVISYFIEYILLSPLLIFFWFIIITLFLFFLAKSQELYNILIIAITLIATTRISAYYNEDLSKDLAKMIPFTLLGIFILDPRFFSIDLVLQRFVELPGFFDLILRFLIVIVLLEFILRILYEIKQFLSRSY